MNSYFVSKKNSNEIFFQKMVLTVFFYISFYTPVYFYFQARLSALLLLVGCFIFTPLILKLEKVYPNASRLAFCFSCLFYIYATPLGIRFPVNIEFYYLAALMVPAIVFDPAQRGWISFCMIMSPTVWSFQQWGPTLDLPDYWLPVSFPAETFKIINFFGATTITGFFMKLFVERINRKNLEIRETLEELNHFFNVALDVLFIADKEGNLRKANPAFTSLMGYSSSDLVFKPFITMVHPADIPRTKEVFEKLKQDHQISNFRNSFRANDGSYKIISWSASTEAESGLVYATGRDITEHVMAEEQARNEKAKLLLNSKLASLGEMSAGIAHEINNPLTIISGHLQLYQKNILHPEKLKSSAEIMLKASEKIAKIIDGLRKFSRCTDNIQYNNHELNQLIKDSLWLIEVKAKRNETEIIFDCHTNAQIQCNGIEIEQAIFNLINNAIDATKNLDEKWVHIHLCEEGPAVVLRIRDSGKGIPDEIAKKIFQPFFTTKPVGEGTGLGLPMVKGILEEHNATIELISKDSNTCFEVRFLRC